jgi:hypothetical protein
MSEQYRLPVRLAAAALQAAMAGKHQTAGRLVERIVTECGWPGVDDALRGLIDTYLDHISDGRVDQYRGRGRVGAWNGDTGAMTTDLTAPEIPERVRWATQLVQARADLDHQRWDELIGELTDDTFGDRVVAVLEGAASTMASVPRGIGLPAAEVLGGAMGGD